MTHHNLDEQEGKEALTTLDGETAVVEETKTKTKKAKKAKPAKGVGRKGKGKGKGTGAPRALKDKINCSNCNNPMTQSTKLNFEEIPGKKIPKSKEGKPAFKSFGVPAGKVAGVLCDDCLAYLEAGQMVSIKTAVIEQADGTIKNVPVDSVPE